MVNLRDKAGNAKEEEENDVGIDADSHASHLKCRNRLATSTKNIKGI